MEGKNFVYAPFWVRTTAITVLTVTLLISIFITFHYVGRTGRETWLLTALSLAQISASGLVLALVVFFSARDVGSLGLQGKADQLLCRTFPGACAFIDFPTAPKRLWKDVRIGKKFTIRNLEQTPTRTEVFYNSGSCAAFYKITTRQSSLMMRIQAHVGEVTVSYYFPASEERSVEQLRSQLEWAVSRYTDIGGYQESWYFNANESFDSRSYVSVHLTKDFGTSFLDDERKKLYFVQDVAASTRSLITHCVGQGITLSH